MSTESTPVTANPSRNRFAVLGCVELEQLRDAARLLRDSEVLTGNAAWGPTSIAALVVAINYELHFREVEQRDAATTARDAEVDAIAAGASTDA